MIKERGLLNLCAVAFKARNICPFLLTEISELLAQPEHIADVGNMVVQDPVAWKVIDGTNGNYMFSRIKPTERSYKYDVVIPLYTAPPKQPESTAEAVMPNGVRVSNVYDAYEEGRKSVMSEQEPDSYTTGVAAKKLFRGLGWTNKGEEK